MQSLSRTILLLYAICTILKCIRYEAFFYFCVGRWHHRCLYPEKTAEVTETLGRWVDITDVCVFVYASLRPSFVSPTTTMQSLSRTILLLYAICTILKCIRYEAFFYFCVGRWHHRCLYPEKTLPFSKNLKILKIRYLMLDVLILPLYIWEGLRLLNLPQHCQ